MPWLLISKTGCPAESVVGSGQFGTPWERMHPLNRRMPVSSCCVSAAESWPLSPAGSRCRQALSAAWYRELLTPSCWALGNFPLPDGSGKFGTPFERMHREKATSWVSAELPEPADDGLPPHAATRTRPTAAMMAAPVRAAGGRARRSLANGHPAERAGHRVMAFADDGRDPRRTPVVPVVAGYLG